MPARDLLLSKRLPGNPLDQQAAAQRALAELANREVIVPQLSGIATDFGVINAGTIVMGNGQPLGSGFTGMIRYADPIEWPSGSGKTWTDIAFNTDVMTFGVSALDGKLYAGSGHLRIDQNNTTFIDDYFGVQFQSVDPLSGSAFTGLIGNLSILNMGQHTGRGMLIAAGSPAFPNLMTNGDFETGTLANWTAVGTASVVTTPVFQGVYAASLTIANTAASLTSDRITSVSDGIGNHYVVGFRAMHNGAGDGEMRLVIKWYDANTGGTLLRTDTFSVAGFVSSSAYVYYAAFLLPPAGTSSCEVIFERNSGGTARIFYIEDVSLRAYGAVMSGGGIMVGASSSAVPLVFDNNGYANPIVGGLQTGQENWVNNNAAIDTFLRGIRAGAMGPYGYFVLHARYLLSNIATGASRSATFTLKFGGTTLHTFNGIASNNTHTMWDIWWQVTNMGTESTQLSTVFYTDHGNVSMSTATSNNNNDDSGANTASIDTQSANREIVIQTQMSAAHSGLSLDRLFIDLYGPYCQIYPL